MYYSKNIFSYSKIDLLFGSPEKSALTAVLLFLITYLRRCITLSGTVLSRSHLFISQVILHIIRACPSAPLRVAPFRSSLRSVAKPPKSSRQLTQTDCTTFYRRLTQITY